MQLHWYFKSFTTTTEWVWVEFTDHILGNFRSDDITLVNDSDNTLSFSWHEDGHDPFTLLANETLTTEQNRTGVAYKSVAGSDAGRIYVEKDE